MACARIEQPVIAFGSNRSDSKVGRVPCAPTKRRAGTGRPIAKPMSATRQFGIPLLGLALAQTAPLLAWTPPGRALFPATTRGSGHAAALTFDDGPDRSLEFFLSALASRGATATFFVMGEQVADDPGR